MRSSIILKSLSLCVIIGLVAGCATRGQSDAAFNGGAVGTVVGAGTGAAIGAAISNGDVAASALLGGGVGLAAGVAGGLIYHAVSRNNEVSSNEAMIYQNQADISDKQREIDQYRDSLKLENDQIPVDSSRREYRYEGASLGNYMR